MNPFINKQCRDYSSNESALNLTQIEQRLTATPNWQFDPEKNVLNRRFSRQNYHQTMAFVNAVAEIAHQQDHHPQMLVSYSSCLVTFSTHSVGGITDNDFICAVAIDSLRGD